MKFKVIGVLVILANLSIQSHGLPFGDFGELASVAEYGEQSAELKRDKRTLTTICVEIKPSSPYEEPYFMCKGTDSPKYTKGSSDSSSSSYSAKPTNSYKPSKPSSYSNGGESDSYHSSDNEYHAPSKPSEYHPEHSKYNSKPSSGGYDSAKEYSAPLKPSYDKYPSYDSHHSDSYSHYEGPSKPSHSSYGSLKPSYADHHDSQDDYSNPHPVHKVTYEKPSAPATYSSKPQTYSHEIPSSYDHRQPSTGGYSKPNSYEGHTSSGGGYSKPSSSYEPSEYSKPSSYDHGSSHDSKPSSYNEESHSKPSYGHGHDGHSYSAPPETKVLYSKPSSYPAKQTAYEHADNSQYGQQKPAYSEQPSSSHYSKPSQDYGKPEQHSAAYAPPQSHNYRMIPQELMQPSWESQPQQLQSDGFGYRSYGAPMEYQQRQETPRMMNPESQLYTGLEGPLRFDLSGSDQEAPTLQSPYLHQTYSSPAPVAPSYAPHYAPAAPLYPNPAYPPAAPAYASVPPSSYVPVAVPSYAPPAAPSYAPAPSSTVYPAPPCPQNYMYSYQPVIMSVPCYSLSAGYSLSNYGQSLGAPAKVNPLQDHPSARSEGGSGNSDSNHKSAEDDSQESQESSDKKPDLEVETGQTTTTLKKSDNLRKPSASSGDNTSEEKKHQVDKNSSQEQVVGGPAAAVAAVEKPIQETQIVAVGTNPKNPNEAPHTKEAFNAMMKMARIAAQLNKDDPSNKGANDAAVGSTMQTNEKPPTGTNLQQFSTRTN